MVLTPNDTWHNHGTVGNEQALNLSVLDLPLVETLNAIHFVHDYEEEENGKMVKKKQQSPRFSTAEDLWLRRSVAPLRRQQVARRRFLLANVRLPLGHGARTS
jgi:gentisate 1,2-dioxygenase